MRKQRTREHIIADLSVNFVERFFLMAGHTAQRILFDYGHDLFVQTFTETGEVEEGYLLIQLKATEIPRFVADGQYVAITVARSDAEFWSEDAAPVFLMLYDAVNELAYWADIQNLEMTQQIALAAGETITLRIPRLNLMNLEAAHEIRRIKNQSVERRKRGDL